jgi:heme a synthase
MLFNPRHLRQPPPGPSPDYLRAALTAAVGFGLVAFVLGAGNRLTRGPWFVYAPEVSPVPPFGRAAWQHAFALHQQSPLYALCGGYDVGGMESVTIYQFLYWWEWSRIASIVLLATSLLFAANLFLRRTLKSAARSDLLVWIGLVAAGTGYFVLRYFADHAGMFATLNIGQHRHALDITFASAGLALLIAGALGKEVGTSPAHAVWAAIIALDIAFGALFEAMDAGPLWTSFPGYADGLLPSVDRLFALHPLWRNLTENGYLIQACHRLLSIGLWGAALLAAAIAILRGRPAALALLLFALLTIEGGLGVAILRSGAPVALSIVHQLGGVIILAVALLPDVPARKVLAGRQAAPLEALQQVSP